MSRTEDGEGEDGEGEEEGEWEGEWEGEGEEGEREVTISRYNPYTKLNSCKPTRGLHSSPQGKVQIGGLLKYIVT